MDGTDKLAEALAKAQGSFSNPERNRSVKVNTKTGGTYSFTYATLDAIMDMIRAPLSQNGLSIVHVLASDEIGWLCVTRLLHTSGQSIECPVPIIVDQSANAQGWGSAITYAKRYGLCALLAITADEDDDGNAACGNHAPPKPRNTPPSQPPKAPAPTPPAPKPPEATYPKTDWASMTDDERFGYLTHRLETETWDAPRLAKMEEFVSKHKGDMKPEHFDEVVKKWRAKKDALTQTENAQ